ncbi:ERF family protein [Winslowiella toletana]|uniref:ERF family protein n=1 Tax=Winslowiella toletana TaxID=92490 RepID=UPI0028BE8725|nr:ERF family protein [Winslowiella toletana]WNN42836.1 ERF family protein [Winslowiella toletana]
MGQLIEQESNNNQVISNAPMRLIEMAVSNNADIEKLERLLDLQTKWDAEQARKSYLQAMSSFQAALPTIKKLKAADFGQGKAKYKYASLDDIAEQIRPYLEQFGLSYRFEQSMVSGVISVKCIASHRDGHSESCEMTASPDASGGKNNIQQSASAVTYLRRYTLTGALGIVTADEDIDGRLPQKSVNGLSVSTLKHITDFLVTMDKTWDEDLLPLCSKIFGRNIHQADDLSEDEAQKAFDFLKKKAKAAA